MGLEPGHCAFPVGHVVILKQRHFACKLPLFDLARCLSTAFLIPRMFPILPLIQSWATWHLFGRWRNWVLMPSLDLISDLVLTPEPWATTEGSLILLILLGTQLVWDTNALTIFFILCDILGCRQANAKEEHFPLSLPSLCSCLMLTWYLTPGAFFPLVLYSLLLKWASWTGKPDGEIHNPYW